MPFFQSRLPDIIIPNGKNVSQVLKARETFEDAEYVILYGISVTDPGITYLVQVCPNIDAAVPVWYTSVNGPGGAQIAPPDEGFAFSLSRASAAVMATDAMRILASGNVRADRSWGITKQWRGD